ncbi:acyltransferase [Paracoccus gahaiensis]|uniref:Acyltransferase n=1 Tax=Paracoccus gahaiensis TaxID=1706839 RepID=A0A4U0R716_9RHOB|nr:acyltransferase family protein [Paracoccus gahaiensis]TJZ90769.1 acyltransferase [Paracoccus gahaiensis]
MTDQTRRASAIDPLRLLLALSVIALHAGFPEAAPALVKQGLFNGLYRLAVPVFALISGYFFLSPLRSGRAGAYLRRIAALYLLWMAIYLPIYGPDFSGPGHVLQTLVFGYFHLWFLPGLLVSAALVWALRAPGRIAVVAGLMAAVGLVLQYLVLSGAVQMQLDHYRNGLFTIFPFFATGLLLAQGWGARLTRLALPLAGLSLLAVIGESLIWYRIAGGGWGIDMMVSLLLAAPLLFLAARQLQGGWDGKRLASVAAFVYFSHILMMITASRFGLEGDTKALVVMGLCLGIALWLSVGERRRVLAFFT